MTANSSDLIYENDRITDGFDIFFWVFNDASSFVPSHWHRAIEMMYILDGEVDVIINAQETVLLSGDIFLIDSSVIHSTKSVHGNHAILIQLPYTLLKKYIAEFDDLNFAFDCHSDNPILHTKILQLIEVVKEMQIIFEVQPKGGILRFNSLVFEMLYQLYHNFSQPIPDTDLRKDEKHFDRLKLVMNYTNDHYNRPLSLDEIANVACFQKEYFCHFFKKNMGKTYLEYLNEIRLSHIYKDLISTDLPLKTLLENNGFTNYKLFRQLFYEHFHMTPGEYRKAHSS
ncbi:MAG: AraC family transcriptional regulator [Lachnospiraceae bacterium]|nr:AraC family transcriptional regulator [Lachnospiraceae bacterium]MDE7030442.1 AraC family transcriptional regulator [Lachnospiraceae bacterium]